jgi:succinate dehydrogenase / fumarate reductase, membrane anchor subunit
MNLRSPLGRVLGLGAAKQGVAHWWVVRVTAIALIPLTLWFVTALLGKPLQSYDTMRGWLGQPWVAVLTILLIVTLAWHSRFGFEEIIVDYVHGKGAKTTLLLLSTFVHFAAAAAGVFAVLILALS